MVDDIDEVFPAIKFKKEQQEPRKSWHDYLTKMWCYARFPFESSGITNKVIKFFNTVLYYATPFGDSPFLDVLL